MNDKLICWDVEIVWKDMDMSGGDNVDGPRWTGGWLDAKTTVAVVATTDALALAAALSLFHRHSQASVSNIKKLRDIAAIVRIEL